MIVQIYKPRKQAGVGESMDQPTARLCRRDCREHQHRRRAGANFRTRTVQGGNAPARNGREPRTSRGLYLYSVDLNQIVVSFAACSITGLLVG